MHRAGEGRGRTNVGYAVMSAVGSTVGSSVGDADGTRVINMVGASVGSLVTMAGAGDGSEREQPSVGRHVPVVKHHGALRQQRVPSRC